MSSDAPDSTQHAVSVLLYKDILSVWSWVIEWENEWGEVNKNIAEDVLS